MSTVARYRPLAAPRWWHVAELQQSRLEPRVGRYGRVRIPGEGGSAAAAVIKLGG